MKFRSVLATVSLAGLLAFAVPARAGVYELTFTGTNFDVTAWFTTDASNDILSIIGNVFPETPLTAGFGGSISGLITQAGTPPGEGTYNGTWNYDDVYNTSNNPSFDNNGVLFAFDSGNIGNIYSVPGVPGSNTYYLSVNSPASLYNPGDAGTLSVSAVPELSTWAMMVLGLAGLGFTGYRRTTNRLPAVVA